MNEREIRLHTCFSYLDATGDVEQARLRFPDLADDIDAYQRTRRLLSAADAGALEERELALRKQAFITRTRRPAVASRRRLPSFRLASVLAAGGLLLAATVGAGASGHGPVNPAGGVLNVLGITHGQSVSEAVQEAQEALGPASEGGPAAGASISEAACTAAHDRSTLPEGAQNAPGQQNRPAVDCTHPANGGGIIGPLVDDEERGPPPGRGPGSGRGQGQAQGEEGDEVGGPAACKELPEQAQQAPGQQNRPEVECDEAETQDETENPGQGGPPEDRGRPENPGPPNGAGSQSQGQGSENQGQGSQGQGQPENAGQGQGRPENPGPSNGAGGGAGPQGAPEGRGGPPEGRGPQGGPPGQ